MQTIFDAVLLVIVVLVVYFIVQMPDQHAHNMIVSEPPISIEI